MSDKNTLDTLRVIIINRRQDADRRQAMCERLDAVGLSYEFFEAVDGHAMDALNAPEYDGPKRRQYFGRDLTAGEIGCMLSHRAIYQKMVDEDIECALVLEDDTFIKPEFPNILTSIFESTVKWDIVRFLNWQKIFRGPHRVLQSLSDGYTLNRVQATPGGAYAYMLTKHAAEVLLQHTQKNWLPVDMIQGRSWETGLNVLVTNPSPVAADFDVPSTIGDVRFDKKITISGLTRVLFPVYRMWFKLSNGLAKRYYFVKSGFQDKLGSS